MTDLRCPISKTSAAIVLVGLLLSGLSLYAENATANSVMVGTATSNKTGTSHTTPNPITGVVADTPPAGSATSSRTPPPPKTSALGSKERARLDEEFELQQMLVDTLDQVERNYVKGISRRELVEAAIEGVLRKLDPYSTYINPKKLSEFRSSVEHEFGGIGIRVGMENGRITVISPIVDTPAHKAGILAGDRIMEIDGHPTKNLSLDTTVEMLQGPIDTDVILTVVHRYTRKLERITVTRQRIIVQTVLGDRRKPDGQWNYFLEGTNRIGYARITGFSRTTPAELRKILKQFTDEGARAMVLDLRFNPGGLLSASVEVSDLFLPGGRIVSIAGRNTKPRTWDATPAGTFDKIPVIILINHYTASAAEIVAAALQDNQRAIIMGERTWGKGSVQNIISLEHGHSALKLTTSAYKRPSGENIHRFPDATKEDKWGVTPDKTHRLRIPPDEMHVLLLDRQRRDVVRSKSSKDPGPLRHRIDADRLLHKAVGTFEKFDKR